ncbi:unnamed protein product (macronuclear) [Paramecium tetraurelia]|uniref:TNFR-Cys domain-containing protein n=1 Tax=Paramecium tetraurelia TaxID=5888 RepID=A0D7C9_PARTE|nr:uncharacterized protein GSPATT00001988001 [Paramecium tetraurelia]CAK78946.1 unnamed protein product [Paramecium tetraurelia]|eukprot:XP_001446343.1 hypothetical protein (macronuclear) [Paramecium tetraurelia strain d4-2]
MYQTYDGVRDEFVFSFVNFNQIGLQKGILMLKLVILTLLISNGNRQKRYMRVFLITPTSKIIVVYYETTPYQYGINACGSSNIFYIDNFGTQYNVLVQKSFGLGPHEKVSIEFKHWKIDNWNSNTFLIYVDNEIIYNQILSCSSSATDICGTSQNDEVTFISKTIVHDRPSIQIVMLAENGRWGISEFILKIEEVNTNTKIQFFDFNGLLDQWLFKESFTSIYLGSLDISDQWKYSGTASTVLDFCHDLYYHQSQGSSFEKSISLPNHVAISLKLKIMIFNSGSTTITLKIDDIIVQNWSYTQQWVGYDNPATVYDGFWYHYTQKNANIIKYAHTNPSIKITILTTTSSVYTPWAPWFGIRDFQLFVRQPSFHICDDQNIYPFDGCFSFNYDCVEGCINCINGVCINCQNGWHYDNGNCSPICGDRILISQEECDDGNQIPYDGCNNCKFSCPLDCDICQFGLCLQQGQSKQQELQNVFQNCKPNLILQNDECVMACYDSEVGRIIENFGCYLQRTTLAQELIYQKVFIEQLVAQQIYETFIENIIYLINQINFNQIDQCNQIDQEICLQCENGYALGINHKQCVPNCGDGIVQNLEICDDSNNIQQDGCYKCQQSCQLECFNCVNGICLICLDGWLLINNSCQQICGDGLIAIQSSEQCDDGNQIDGDGCFLCLFECSPYCLYCIDQNECLYCQDHFELIQKGCRPICGDLYIVEGLEECDDGNQISNDGCYDCQFQCEINCQKCIKGKCFEYIKPQEPIINDTTIIIEQLDQICSQGCLICLEGKCQSCDKFSTLKDEQCIQYGNGIIQKGEFCDDGNSLNNDGCSENYNIEQGWDCHIPNDQFSQCYKITQLSLNFLNQSYNTEYLSLTYSKKVKLNQSNQIFIDQASIFIQDLNSDQYNLSIEPVTEIIFDLVRDINYIIKITFLEKLENTPTLTVSISTVLLDENDILVPSSSSDIALRIPQVMGVVQMLNTEKLTLFGQSIMMGLTGFGVFLLIFGQLAQFLEILDILQYQSYLKFINVEFPQNLYIYFQSSDFVQLQNIMINFRIVETLNLFIYEEKVQSHGKFYQYQLNADLLSNIYGQVAQILAIFFGYWLVMFYISLTNNNCFTARSFYNLGIINCKIVDQMAIKFYYLYRSIHKLVRIKLSQQFIFFFQSNSFDLIFKILLFLDSNVQFNMRSEISFGICLMFFMIVINCIFKLFQRETKLIRIKNIKEQQLESIILLKKFVFLLILIKVQVQPLLQCLLLSFSQLLFIEIIWFFQLANSKFEFIIIFLNEFPIMLFTFMIAAFSLDFSQYLNQNTKLSIGFFLIGILLISIFGPILKQLRHVYNKIENYLRERKEEMKKINIQSLFYTFKIN